MEWRDHSKVYFFAARTPGGETEGAPIIFLGGRTVIEEASKFEPRSENERKSLTTSDFFPLRYSALFAHCGLVLSLSLSLVIYHSETFGFQVVTSLRNLPINHGSETFSIEPSDAQSLVSQFCYATHVHVCEIRIFQTWVVRIPEVQ